MGNRYFINGDTLTGIADSIREKTGKTAAIKPTEMADEIASISGGGEFPDTALEALGHYTSSPDIDSAYYYSANSWHQADSDDNALVFYDENHWRRPNYAEFLYLDIDTMAWTTVITPEAFLNGITDRGTPLIDTDKIFQYVDDEWVQVEYNDDVTVPAVDFSKLTLSPYLNGTVFSSTPSSVNIPTFPESVFKPGSKSWEMQFKFRQTATSTYATIIGTAKSSQPYNIIIEIKSGKVMCYICNKATPNTDDVYLTGKTTIELNKWYWVNVTRIGNRFTMMLSENGEGFTIESTQTSSIEVNENGYNYTLFGCWGSNRFYGDIDLDASYIIVDGVKTWGITKENTPLETMLPDGYTRVACLESTGTQYIKTGIMAQYGLTTTATVCSKVMADNYDAPVLSARSDNGKVRVYNLFLCNGICYGDGTGYYTYNGSLKKRVTKIETTLNETDIVIKFDNESPVTKTFTSMGVIQDNLELYMFASNYNGAKYINQLQIFELEISKDGTKLAHYIPCLDTEGVPCMYDLVTKTTKYNAGTGQFDYQVLTETVSYKKDKELLMQWDFTSSEPLVDKINNIVATNGINIDFDSDGAHTTSATGGAWIKLPIQFLCGYVYEIDFGDCSSMSRYGSSSHGRLFMTNGSDAGFVYRYTTNKWEWWFGNWSTSSEIGTFDILTNKTLSFRLESFDVSVPMGKVQAKAQVDSNVITSLEGDVTSSYISGQYITIGGSSAGDSITGLTIKEVRVYKE